MATKDARANGARGRARSRAMGDRGRREACDDIGFQGAHYGRSPSTARACDLDGGRLRLSTRKTTKSDRGGGGGGFSARGRATKARARAETRRRTRAAGKGERRTFVLLLVLV